MKKLFISFFLGAILFSEGVISQVIISGYVYQPDSVPIVIQGKALLFQYDTTKPVFPKVDSVNIGIDGDFYFYAVQPGNYLIKVYPDPLVYPGLLPTYHGDTVFWSGATVLSVDSSNLYNKNVNMKKKPSWVASTNYCSGNISFGTGKTSVSTFGDPVPGIDVSLTQIPGGVMRSTTTNPTGFFQFGNIPDNSTYKVIVDLPGAAIPDPLQITMGNGGDTVLNVNYNVDTMNGTIFSIIKILYPEISAINIFPNPNDGKFQLSIAGNQLPDATLKVYSMLGETVYQTLTNSQLPVTVDLTYISSGIYFVQVNAGEKVYSEKIVLERE